VKKLELNFNMKYSSVISVHPNVEKLKISGCFYLQNVNFVPGNSLKKLSLHPYSDSNWHLLKVPSSVTRMIVKLDSLVDVENFNKMTLPELKVFEMITLDTEIKKLPNLPNSVIDLGWRSHSDTKISISDLPSILTSLALSGDFNIDNTKFPSTLKVLYLNFCDENFLLPEDLPTGLKTLILKGSTKKPLPKYMPPSLQDLFIDTNCKKSFIHKLPDSIVRLSIGSLNGLPLNYPPNLMLLVVDCRWRILDITHTEESLDISQMKVPSTLSRLVLHVNKYKLGLKITGKPACNVDMTDSPSFTFN
jgi:hypothetical protein